MKFANVLLIGALLSGVVVTAMPVVQRAGVMGRIDEIKTSAFGHSAATAGTDGKASSFAGATDGKGFITGFAQPGAVLGFVLPSPTL